jgi:diguanylate cyclase (GGDEF)-like protein
MVASLLSADSKRDAQLSLLDIYQDQDVHAHLSRSGLVTPVRPGLDLDGDLPSPQGPGSSDVRLTQIGVFISLGFVLGVIPFAATKLPQFVGFEPAYEGWSILCEAMMSVLLFSQFSIVKSRGLLTLACGCLVTALAAVARLLAAPGEFAPNGLFGGGVQSPVWLFMIWTASFPTSVIIYSVFKGPQGLVNKPNMAPSPINGGARIGLAVTAVVAGMIALFVAIGSLARSLPPVMDHGVFTPFAKICATGIVAVAMAALAVVWRRTPRTTLDGWLLMGLIMWLFDLALSGLLSHTQYDLAWYAGRAYGAVSAGLLLILLSLESANQYRQVFELHNALVASNEALHHLSLHDALTALPNRRYFDDHLNEQSAVMRRHRRSMAIVIFDVDDFKTFNDHFGHQAGDNCLSHIAQVLKSCCRRPTDLAARYGGEEFAFILPETDLASAMRVAESAREAIEHLQIRQGDGAAWPHVTISGGVAVYDGSGDMSLEAVIAAADEALFQAKSRGRNRIISQKLERSSHELGRLRAV